MSNEIVIPFKGQARSQAFQAALGGQQESLSDGIGSSYAVIGYKGKTWSIRHRGEQHVIVRPEDGSPSNHIDLIILNQARHKSKSFFPNYVEGQAGMRPICSSLNGVVPDADVQQQQNPTCALCVRNEWKTSAEGRKSRECQDYKRLAVLLLPSMTKALFGGKPLMEPMFLRIPPASLNDLALFGETMQNQGYHYSEFITRVSFDPLVSHPKMLFRPLQLLTDKEAPLVIPLRQDPTTMRILGEEVGVVQQVQHTQTQSVTTGLAQAMQPAAQQVQQPVQQPAQAAPPPKQAEPETVDTGFDALSVMQEAQSTDKVQPGRTPPGGLLDLQANPEPQPQQAAAQPKQTVEDVGAIAESDAALDERINALMKTS